MINEELSPHMNMLNTLEGTKDKTGADGTAGAGPASGPPRRTATATS